MDDITIDKSWTNKVTQEVNENMKKFSDKKVRLWNACHTIQEIKKFLESLTNSIMKDLSSRQDILTILLNSITINDTMSIKIMSLEKRIKELEEKLS